jgi:hypothetical protein
MPARRAPRLWNPARGAAPVSRALCSVSAREAQQRAAAPRGAAVPRHAARAWTRQQRRQADDAVAVRHVAARERLRRRVAQHRQARLAVQRLRGGARLRQHDRLARVVQAPRLRQRQRGHAARVVLRRAHHERAATKVPRRVVRGARRKRQRKRGRPCRKQAQRVGLGRAIDGFQRRQLLCRLSLCGCGCHGARTRPARRPPSREQSARPPATSAAHGWNEQASARC